jgi:acid phosphatase class B
VPKCGGGRELTKQSADEIVAKCHVSLDQTDKIRSDLNGVFDKNSLAVGNKSIGTNVEIEPKVKLGLTRKEVSKPKLEKFMSEIDDIENGVEREKPVKIDFDIDLYQMEEP